MLLLSCEADVDNRSKTSARVNEHNVKTEGSSDLLSVVVFEKIYQGSDLLGQVGKVEGTSRVAIAAPDQQGTLAYGPYDNAWPEGQGKVTFDMHIDVVHDHAEHVATIDVYDATAGQVIASKKIERRDFPGNFQKKGFDLLIDTNGREDHAMETRVFVFGRTFISLNYVKVTIDGPATSEQTSDPASNTSAPNSQVGGGEKQSTAAGISGAEERFYRLYNPSELQGGVGSVDGFGRSVVAAPGNRGHLVYGPYANDWAEGDGRVSFELLLDVVDTNNENVIEIDIYDATAGQILAKKTLSRKDFGGNFVAQKFDLYFSTKGRAGNVMETRVFVEGNSYVRANKIEVEIFPRAKSEMPQIIDLTNYGSGMVANLVAKALNGLGFSADQGAPSANDLVVVSDEKVVWIDQTGFVGKMNGLWKLKKVGSGLDFALVKDGRPVNYLIPGEQGRGRWRGTYAGAEHFELPNENREPSQDCGEICGWYAYNEAPQLQVYTPGVTLPHWTICNGVKPGFDFYFEAIKKEVTNDFVEVWYRERLVKMADNSRVKDSGDCGLDYVFSDGRRRPVYLQTGYRIYKDKNYVDRLYRYENAEQNPTFSPNWSLIGGFVITDLNERMPEKAFYNYYTFSKSINAAGVAFQKDVPTPLISEMPTADIVIGWAQSSYIASRTRSVGIDTALGLSHPDMGLSPNPEDIGTCICVIHGGLEMGGGVLAKPTGAVPLAPGKVSVSNTRRLWLPNSTNVPFEDK